MKAENRPAHDKKLYNLHYGGGNPEGKSDETALAKCPNFLYNEVACFRQAGHARFLCGYVDCDNV